MKGFESEDLYGPVTEQHQRLTEYNSDPDDACLMDYIAWVDVFSSNDNLLR
jgi:hypothetical protein